MLDKQGYIYAHALTHTYMYYSLLFHANDCHSASVLRYTYTDCLVSCLSLTFVTLKQATKHERDKPATYRASSR